MSIYKRSDLMYVYNWSTQEGDDPKLRGEPDKSLFNRVEGYEVLYLINKFLSAKGLTSVLSGNKVERLLYSHLPKGSHTQEDVLAFIEKNFRNE